jgi:hypothetical protein
MHLGEDFELRARSGMPKRKRRILLLHFKYKMNDIVRSFFGRYSSKN